MERISYLKIGAASYGGVVQATVEHALNTPLKDRALWNQFVEVFRIKADEADAGWRGEFWGKTMRGGCMVYEYTADEELYEILKESVLNLLSVADERGAFTSYQTEFRGWDMWSRKYVLTAMQHFYAVCKEEELKNALLTAMKKHADCIIEGVGEREGQISIVKTSGSWGGLNSCSILEAFVELYKLTGVERYLEFARYILSTGGSRHGDLLKAAEENILMPYQYPVVKAYEAISFFEGALAFFEATGEERYLQIVKNFVYAVLKTDYTQIGCCGCAEECFDNSTEKQTERGEPMQETCVTVTLMRILARLYRQTGDTALLDAIENSYHNAFLGSVNTLGVEGWHYGAKHKIPPLPFDSYSPLVENRRGLATAGLRNLPEGGYYGCCACISSAGVALYPLLAVVENTDNVFVNFLEEGIVKTEKGSIRISGNKIFVHAETSFLLKVRIPAWSKGGTLVINGEKKTAPVGYFAIECQKGERTVEVDLQRELSVVEKNGKLCVRYGEYVLARDEGKGETPLAEPMEKAELLKAKKTEPQNGERVRFSCGEVVLTDYASCGKDWWSDKPNVSVWLNQK